MATDPSREAIRDWFDLACPASKTCLMGTLPQGSPLGFFVSMSSGPGTVYAEPAACWLSAMRAFSSSSRRFLLPKTQSAIKSQNGILRVKVSCSTYSQERYERKTTLFVSVATLMRTCEAIKGTSKDMYSLCLRCALRFCTLRRSV